MGRNIGVAAFEKRIRELWKPNGEMDIIILDFRYYLIKFDNDIDQDKVLLDGPWIVQGHYLTVRRWLLHFRPSDDTIESTLAWVRFPELFMMYYNEDVLFALASRIGTPIKVDINTRLATRARFAKVCIEIDLTKSLDAKFCLDDNCYSVEYEGIHTICFACGMYDHRTEQCLTKTQANIMEGGATATIIEHVVHGESSGDGGCKGEKGKENVDQNTPQSCTRN